MKTAQPTVLGLRSLGLDRHYEGLGRELVNDLIVPALKSSVRYDRLTSFFTAHSLIACAEGIDDLWRRRCKIRLVLGIHSVPRELAYAATPSAWVDQLVRDSQSRLLDECTNLTDEVARNQIGALATMLRSGFLEVRVACPRDRTGILHSKRYLFFDSSGDSVIATGSPNETGAAHSTNFEELSVDLSWEPGSQAARLINSFEMIWQNRRPDLEVRPLDEDFAERLLRSVSKPTSTRTGRNAANPVARILSLMRTSPEFAFANVAHAALFPHQERALRDATSRWPIRVLLADEVGLGKTIEAGSVIAYSKRFLGVRRILILTPSGLRQQWQSELLTHFDIRSWRFDSGSCSFISPDQSEIPADRSCPLDNAPDVVLVSWQLARKSWRSDGVFARSAWKPDLILVDEAHNARRTRSQDKRFRTTMVWKLVNELAATCPHLVLLTATPMQIQVEEYHGLLMLLGLPEWWSNADRFVSLLSSLEHCQPVNELDRTRELAEAVSTGLTMAASPGSIIPHDCGLTLEDVYPPPVRIPQVIALRERGMELSALAVASSPPSFLTVRNTRRGLEALGYRFPKREFHAPDLTLDEKGREFFHRIRAYLDDAYGKVEGALGRSDGGASPFVRSTYYQRLVSSRSSARLTLDRRAATLVSFLDSGTWRDEELLDDDLEMPDESDNDETKTKIDIEAAKQFARIELQYLQQLIDALVASEGAGKDPKVIALTSIIERCISTGDSALVFSRFTDTVEACINALSTHLRNERIGFGTYTAKQSWIDADGTLTAVDKTALCIALRQGKVRVIFCSEAASEGLNLQAARCLVNIDVPWNPARLEQRIGRIARLGQKADSVDIFNLWYPGTIEEQMYSRLLRRQKLYKLAVGEFPEVIGEAIRSQLRAGETLDFDAIETRISSLRDRAEMRALDRIWSRTRKDLSVGEQFRELLASVVVHAAQRQGLPVDGDSMRFTVALSDRVVTVDTAAGQPDSLHLYHEAMTVVQQTSATPAMDIALDGLAVVGDAHGPLALLMKGEGGFHVQGPTATAQVLLSIVAGHTLAAQGPVIPFNASRDEVIAGLREAFPSRIELADVLVPTASVPPAPARGEFQITPLSELACI